MKCDAKWFQQHLLTWFAKHGRHDLPWKKPIDPYRIWVSEIMLQQTQVSTVIGYFEKFMRAFPSVHELAITPLDKVMHYWSGLGYYARGRNLHKSAQMIVNQHQGKLPKNLDALMALPGIGRSTAGAILAQSYNQRAPILDGNVKRVLCRFFAIEGVSSEKSIETKLWEIAEKLTPQQHVADYTQAMMDLGATLCTRTNPSCSSCPLQKKCRALELGTPSKYPTKKVKKKLPIRHTTLLYVTNHQQEILLQQRPLQGIWGGLWSLPEFKDENQADAFLRDHFKGKKASISLCQLKHTFTHFHLLIDTKHTTIAKSQLICALPKDFCWVNQAGIKARGLPAPIKKILKLAEIQ